MKKILLLALVAILPLISETPAFAMHGDIHFSRGSKMANKAYPPATFPHWVHRMQFKCYVCHDKIFKMKAGADKISMDEINAGKYCGVCHDAKTAFGPTFGDCVRCHVK